MRRLTLVLFLLFGAAEGWAAVAENGTGTALVELANGTTVDLTTFTVDSGSSQCLIAVLTLIADTGTSPSVTWDQGGTNQAMTPIMDDGNNTTGHMYAYYRIGPTTGNNIMRASWTTNDGAALAAINFSGADQTTCVNAAHNVTTTIVSTTPLVVTVTSSTDGATISAVSSLIVWTAATFTVFYYHSSGFYSGDYTLGNASNAHSWTRVAGAGNVIGIGFHIIAAGGGGVTSKSTLSLLGVGR